MESVIKLSIILHTTELHDLYPDTLAVCLKCTGLVWNWKMMQTSALLACFFLPPFKPRTWQLGAIFQSRTPGAVHSYS